MSILTAIFDSNKVFGFEQAFGAKDITTPEELKAKTGKERFEDAFVALATGEKEGV